MYRVTRRPTQSFDTNVPMGVNKTYTGSVQVVKAVSSCKLLFYISNHLSADWCSSTIKLETKDRSDFGPLQGISKLCPRFEVGKSGHPKYVVNAEYFFIH